MAVGGARRRDEPRRRALHLKQSVLARGLVQAEDHVMAEVEDANVTREIEFAPAPFGLIAE